MEVKWCSDSTIYTEPEEIVLPLYHRDVRLGFFKAKNHYALMEEVQRVVCCSKRYYEDICKQNKKGYVPCEAKVQFVVSWWDKEKQ